MNKNSICTLLLGASLLGCDAHDHYGPVETKKDGSSIRYIPAECKEIVTLTLNFGGLLTCKDDKGNYLFYLVDHHFNWKKY